MAWAWAEVQVLLVQGVRGQAIVLLLVKATGSRLLLLLVAQQGLLLVA